MSESKRLEIFEKSNSQHIEGSAIYIDGELRYIVMDSETGEIYDNAHGFGYASEDEALLRYRQLCENDL